MFSMRKPKFLTRSGMSLILALITSLLLPIQTADAAAQKVNFYINGDCLDYYDMEMKTSSKGVAYLDFNAYCDGSYCDGTWKYRIVVDSTSGQSSRTSPTFEVSYYPGYADDYSEEDDGY